MVRNWIKKYYVAIPIFLLIFTLGAGIYLKNSNSYSKSSQVSDIKEKLSEKSEPEINAWATYSNNKYYFAFEVPAKWHIQDYSAFFGDTGSTLIAFSPNSLPCEMCSYFHDGYFSIRIYNKQTDPGLYEIFIEKMEDTENSNEYKKVEIANKTGVAFANSVAVEHQGWVYELSLDKDEGKANTEDSKIFQRVISSFTFTSIFQ